MYAAIDGLVDKLDRQIIKHKEKIASASATIARSKREARADAPLEQRLLSAALIATLPGADACSSRPMSRRCQHASNMNLIAKLLPERTSCSTSTSPARSACSSRSALLFENNHSIAARRRLRQPVRAREARLDRARPGHRHPARPHQGAKEAVGAFVRLRQPIPFDAPDGKTVSQIFVLLVPEHATDLHLQILSELAQMFSEQIFPRAACAPPRTRPTLHALIHALAGPADRRRRHASRAGHCHRTTPTIPAQRREAVRGQSREAQPRVARGTAGRQPRAHGEARSSPRSA